MGAYVRREERMIYFLTDQRAHKDEEIDQFPQVCLCFADTRHQNYLSLSGSAEITSDREKIRELWGIPARVWWDSPDDPNIRLLKVTPRSAEFWDAPGNLVSSFKVAFALATGTHLDAGEHKRVEM